MEGTMCFRNIVRQTPSRHQAKLSISRRLGVRCQASVSGRNLELHIGETTIAFPFDPVKGRELSSSITSVIQTFSDKQKAERPKRWPSMEYRCKGESAEEAVDYLEMFCNPNAHSSVMDARVLITLRTTQGVKVMTEARLTGIKSDVDAFIEQTAPQPV